MEDNKGDAEGDTITEVTYLADENECLYCHPSGDTQNVISLALGTSAGAAGMPAVEGLQTLTLVPSDKQQELSYVIIVQDPIIGGNLDVNQLGKGNDLPNLDYIKNVDQQDGNNKKATKDSLCLPQSQSKRYSKTAKPTFTCEVCSYTTDKRQRFTRHMRIHSDERPYKCIMCDRGFRDFRSMHNHESVHSGIKTHECKDCDKSFTTGQELLRHVLYKHTSVRPHKCSKCDYAAVELSKLRRHSRCHDRPHQCPHCRYAATDAAQLTRHLCSHTGEKPYKCDKCDKSYTKSKSLKAHSATHEVSKITIYPCEMCSTQFILKEHLHTHIQKEHASKEPGKRKVHTKSHDEKFYKCHICAYEAQEYHQLKIHLHKHPEINPFICDHCGRPFNAKFSLQRHMNTHHLKTKTDKTRKIREENIQPEPPIEAGVENGLKNGALVTVGEGGDDQAYVVSDIIPLENDKEGHTTPELSVHVDPDARKIDLNICFGFDKEDDGYMES